MRPSPGIAPGWLPQREKILSDNINATSGNINFTMPRAKPPALPLTVTDLIAGRKININKTLNDHVDEIHTALWGDPEYQKLLDAVYDDDAVEGSLAIDNSLAATRIRDWAKEHDHPYVSGKKLATIVKSLNIVLRRYGIGRTERRNMIDGQIVPGNNHDQ